MKKNYKFKYKSQANLFKQKQLNKTYFRGTKLKMQLASIVMSKIRLRSDFDQIQKNLMR